MRRIRAQATVTAALLVAALAFSSVAALGHRHEALTPAEHLTELPVYSAGHERPEETVHIESAWRVESSSCIACAQRQRQSTAEALAPSLAALSPGGSAVAMGCGFGAVADCHGIPASRAPPRA